MPRKPGGETAFATTFMFEIASPASNRPALRPTRGSFIGVGAVLGFDGAHAARPSSATAA